MPDSGKFNEKSDVSTKDFLLLMLTCLQEISDELMYLTQLFEADEYTKCSEMLHTTIKKKIYANHEDVGKLYAWTDNAIRLGYFANSSSEKTLLLALCADIEKRAEDIIQLAPEVIKFNPHAPAYYFIYEDSHINWLIIELESRVDEE